MERLGRGAVLVKKRKGVKVEIVIVVITLLAGSVLARKEEGGCRYAGSENHRTCGEIPYPGDTTHFLSLRPNPCTDSTEFFYSVPIKTKVSLKVYDCAGKLVKTLVAGFVSAGYWRVSWDGKDDWGRFAHNGFYFILLETSFYSAVGKLVLFK